MADKTPDHVVRRLRELIPKIGVTKAARAVGVSPTVACDIKSGKRRRGVGEVTINELGLRRSSGKLCRKCGNPTNVVTRSLVCVGCEVIELAKQGLVTIADDMETQDAPSNIPSRSVSPPQTLRSSLER